MTSAAPWRIHNGDNRHFFVDSATQGAVCKIASNPHERANARLIAAAPRMLQLLKDFCDGKYTDQTGALMADFDRDVVAVIRAAID